MYDVLPTSRLFYKILADAFLRPRVFSHWRNPDSVLLGLSGLAEAAVRNNWHSRFRMARELSHITTRPG